MKWRVPDQEADRRGLGQVVQKDCQAPKLNRDDAMDNWITVNRAQTKGR